MNKRTISVSVVAAFAAILLTGCEKENDLTGKAVRFSANVTDKVTGTRSDLPDTRVAYGTATGTGAQSINWLIGDRITIYCAQCLSETSAEVSDYLVTSVSSSSASNANIGPSNPAGGLQWNEGSEHTFYAVYPGVGTTDASVAILANDITGSIPQMQKHPAITGTDSIVVAPDMKNMYMTAKTVTAPSAESVELEFKPLSTALEFVLGKEDSESVMSISSITLTSQDFALNGGFSVDLDAGGRYDRPKTVLTNGTVDNTEKSITISFVDGEVTLAKGKKLTFTFFLNPGNPEQVNDLSFSISGMIGDEPFERSTKLVYENGTGITFPTHQKTRIKGLMLPDGVEWTISYLMGVEPWAAGDSKEDNPSGQLGVKPILTQWIFHNYATHPWDGSEAAVYDVTMDLDN